MKKLLLFAVALFLMTTALKASHVAGGELTYQWISGSDYLITFTFYRDCSGVSEPSQVDVSFHSDSCGMNFTVSLFPIPGTGQEVTNICPKCTTHLITTCKGGTLFGVQKWEYQGVVTLPSCEDWVMSCSISARNPITTLSSSGNFYIEAHLDNVTAPKNSSPDFYTEPVSVVCINQPAKLQFQAVDADGDSLAYSLISPLTGTNTTVSYNPPYTYQQFLPSTPPITIDGLTGDVAMNPTQILNTVAAVSIEEYRNGVKIGSVVRDMLIIVYSCDTIVNNSPELGGINASAMQYNPNDTIYSINVLAGDTVKFTIYASDPDADSVTLNWHSYIPAASLAFTGQNTLNAAGHFQWLPTLSDTLDNPHCFVVTATDNHCCRTASRVFAYYLNAIKPVAGLSELVMNNNIKVYPNPSKGIFTVSIAGISKATKLSVTNIQGQEVYSKHLSPVSKQEQINLNGYAKGIYFLKVTGENFVKMEKVIMQ